MKKFINLEKEGQLNIDKIFFESYFPIIFTCVNDRKDIFICVCCQNNEQGCKWLLRKVNAASIVKMLRNEITVRQLLLDCSSEKITVDYVDSKFEVSYGNSDWDENSLYLPKVDSYIDAEEGEFDDEIAYFSSLNNICYSAEYYKQVEMIIESSINCSVDIHVRIDLQEEYTSLYNTVLDTMSESPSIGMKPNDNDYLTAA